MLLTFIAIGLLTVTIFIAENLGYSVPGLRRNLQKCQQLAAKLNPKVFLRRLALFVAVYFAAIAAAIYWGGPKSLPPLASISTPFRHLDYAALPTTQSITARDGQTLAYRAYLPKAASLGAVVLVHGSSASSRSMHHLALGLQAAGYSAFALDIRGHGDSLGTLGQGKIAYLGQLEDDLNDAMQFLNKQYALASATLIGFSSGGGFALRVAGSASRQHFQHFVLLAPFISQDAPTYRPNSGGWVSVGLPRIIALSVLNGFGITRWNHLAVTAFAVSDNPTVKLTPSYDFALATNFRPLADYHANLKAAASARITVLVGEADELFVSEQFAPVFAQSAPQAKVNRLKGLQHMDLILDPQAIARTVQAVQSIQPTQH